MSRLIAIFLLVALSLSWTAGALAAYCSHETFSSDQIHLGHHQSGNETALIVPDVDNANGGGISCHANCVLTHCMTALPIAAAPWAVSFPPQQGWFANAVRLWSNITGQPERPQWRVLA